MDTMNPEEQDFYQKLRSRIKRWSAENKDQNHPWTKWLLLAPDFFHLLVRLAADPEVPLDKKAKLGAVLLYFISPIDLLSELLIGAPGFVDDVVLSAYVLNDFINTVDGSIVEKHWAGDEDVLGLIQKILTSADQVIGSGLFRKIKRFWGRRQQ